MRFGITFNEMVPRPYSVFRTSVFSLFLLAICGCTGLFSTVFGQDDPSLFVDARPLYELPFVKGNARYLLVQGIGGRFSHTGENAWSFDWSMAKGTPVIAARDGMVISLRNDANDKDLPLEKRRANFVRVRHSDGEISCYAHLDSTSAIVGQTVARGDRIGTSGNSGFSTQPHLHFHVEKDGVTIPIAFSDVSGGLPRVGRFYP